MSSYRSDITGKIIKMRDIHFSSKLFESFCSKTTLDELLCSYKGLPKGVNYMVIGDPGVGKTNCLRPPCEHSETTAQSTHSLH